jgi:hypothetical protein
MSWVSFRRTLVVAGGAVVVASVARADAPAGTSDSQYGTFDETNVFIYDRHTGLTWQRAASSQLIPLGTALAYCQGLSLGTLTSDWRIPSYKELLTIVDESPHAEYDMATGAVVYKAIDPNAFGFVLSRGEQTPVGAGYWSSSLVNATLAAHNCPLGCAYVVEFRTGSTEILPIETGTLVRCVHD